MAAGDVTGFWYECTGRARAGGAPFGANDRGYLFGCQVQLDGDNPTTVNVAGLSGEIRRVLGATVALAGSSAPGLDPLSVSAIANAGALEVYAWKPTAQGDATLIASEDATRVVEVFGWGTDRP